ncbi:pentatricopeptide repeat-containing protein At3g50420 [Dendrobium catenatum]|nr:pentatricopeptide repeat-containing protein At3g50420 [Dendrobium catenatum]
MTKIAFITSLLASPTSYEASLATVAESLRRLPSTKSLRKCRQLHAFILTSAPSPSIRFLFNNLLSLYSKCGALLDAHKLFDRMSDRNTVSYNAIMSAYSRFPCHATSCMHLFHDMSSVGITPNASTFSALAHVIHDHRAGSAVHCRVVVLGFYGNVFVKTSLLRMYLGCLSLESAERIFHEMPEKDEVAWNSMLLSRLNGCEIKRALQLYVGMVQEGLEPTPCTFTMLLTVCRKAEDLNAGRVVHGHIIKSKYPPDIPLQNALLDMYASCGDVRTAELVFERIDDPNLVSWNSLMAGFSSNCDGEKAIGAFVKLKLMNCSDVLPPDEYTFAAVVAATAAFPSLFYGKPLHAEICKTGWTESVYVGQTLIGMYFMNSEPLSAEKIFHSVPQKDVVIWTEMVAGHSMLGGGEMAIQYFSNMLVEGHEADSFSLSSAIKASAFLTALRQGEMFHGLVIKVGYGGNSCVCGSLVDMYAKNGSLESCRFVFDTIRRPDLICWNSVIGGFGNHGNAEEAFSLFRQMVESGLQPDHVTYISLLSACSHCGLLERARFYWFCMMNDGIIPGLKHYTYMVNLLSRAGLLREAEELIASSPFGDCSTELWRILLSSSVVSKDLDMGNHAAKKVLNLEPDDLPTHILLSNLYASVGSWDEVVEVRRKIRGLLVGKEPGLSWIGQKNTVHVFSADDDCHAQIDDCRNELLRLQENMEGSDLHNICF